MTTLAVQPRERRTRPVRRSPASASGRGGDQPAPTLFTDVGGEPTLDDLVTGVWEGLAAQQPAACPLCAGTMIAAYGAHARPTEGRCTDCGTTLS